MSLHLAFLCGGSQQALGSWRSAFGACSFGVYNGPRTMFPQSRTREVTPHPANPAGDFVLYWMTAARRPFWNHALTRAVQWAETLQKPLVILEPLRCDYPWASARFHRFVVEGMAFNAAYFAERAALYVPYVEPQKSAGRGLLTCFGERACVVVGDDFPCFFLPHMTEAAAQQLGKLRVRFEAIDSNGLFPMRAAPEHKLFKRAFDFRNHLRRHLWPHLAPDQLPDAEPLLNRALPTLSKASHARILKTLQTQWPSASPAELLQKNSKPFAALPIDHTILPVHSTPGGADAARTRLSAFILTKLPRYADERSHPDADASSGLSPYLHFGHLSAHEVLHAIAAYDGHWQLSNALTANAHLLGDKPKKKTKKKKKPDAEPSTQETSTPTEITTETPTEDTPEPNPGAWWGFTKPESGAFMDELVTWRELGFNACVNDPNYAAYASLPAWAQATLEAHQHDPREHIYTLAELASAQTSDPLWNAAQRQLITEGVIQNYLRMLWGKRVLAWTRTPQEALAFLLELNNRFALDGRNPNSYSGIFWVFGRYDRAWGPERPIYGKIRYMTSDSAQHKLRLKQYLAKWG
jgi:deoxyribodipyrimidine photo-lyase